MNVPLHRRFQVALTQQDVFEELAKHPRIVLERARNFGALEGPPRRFLLVKETDSRCYLVPESKLTASPAAERDIGSDRNRIVVSLRSIGSGSGTQVVADLRTHPSSSIRRRRLLLSAVLGPLATVAGGVLLLFGAIWGFGLWGLICSVGVVVGIVRGNRPASETVAALGPDIWQVLGEVFVPHEVGDGRRATPYRLR